VLLPPHARCLLVLAHGAGAGIKHPFLEGISRRLFDRKVGTFRFHFPYMEARRRRPDAPAVLTATVRSAVAVARETAGALPLVAGGKSLGGRMISLTVSERPLESVRGLIFFGFPLHAAGKPSIDRAEHLKRIELPMLFLQGTRDSLAHLERIRYVCAGLGSRAALHVVEGGDHSFRLSKPSGGANEKVLDELADIVATWALRLA
jgi:predicted alpha/beta-hydrolase family hydrolase